MPILHEPLDLVQRLIILLILCYYRLLVFLPRLGHGSMLRAASGPVAGGKKQVQVMGTGASSRRFLGGVGSQLRVACNWSFRSVCVCLGYDGRGCI